MTISLPSPRPAHGRQPGPSAVHVAYAIRWLELVDGAATPAWQAWLDVSVEQAGDGASVAPLPGGAV